MQLVNPLTAFVWKDPLDINGVAMSGIVEKQGHAFSRAGYLAALDDPTLDADAVGAAVRRSLRPLSKLTLDKARAEYGRREVIPFPRYFIIEPAGGICNRRCPFCSIIVTPRKGFMEWATFTKLMQECSQHDVYGISLYQLGESFLWHGGVTHYIGDERERIEHARLNISDMANYAKQIGGFRAVNLSTNGDVDNLDCVLGSQLDDLIISIDGMTAEVYDANRPSTKAGDSGAYERTMARVREFLEHKAKLGEAKPFVRLQIINKENTAAQVIDFIRFWIDMPGVDDVLIKNLDGMSAWLSDSVVSAEETALKMAKVKTMPCQHLWGIGSMTFDGSLNGCCHDALTELTTAGANINSMTFAEWWTGAYMQSLRNEHAGGVFRLPCRDCAERDVWTG